MPSAGAVKAMSPLLNLKAFPVVNVFVAIAPEPSDEVAIETFI
ncbi:hypothetical protein [Tenacibaculum sp.]